LYTWLNSDDAGYVPRRSAVPKTPAPKGGQDRPSRRGRPGAVSLGDLTMRFSRRRRRAEIAVTGAIGAHALDGLTDFLNGVDGHGVTVVTVDVNGLEPSVAAAALETLRQLARQFQVDGAELVVVGADL
jgi:hypothetical protein